MQKWIYVKMWNPVFSSLQKCAIRQCSYQILYPIGINQKAIIRVKILVLLKSYRGLRHIWLGQAWCQLTPTGQTIHWDKRVECLLSASVVGLLSLVPVWIFELLCTEVSPLSSRTQRHLNPNETKWQLKIEMIVKVI